MPERTSHPHGTPSWVDLTTTDQAAAKQFYGELFGWEFDDNPVDENTVYSMALKGGKAVAAISPQPEQMAGMPPVWNTYVTVDDVDARAGKVEGAGGTVMAPPFDVMDAGRMAVVVDPTGAVLMLWQPKESIGAELVNEHGTLTWNELMTPDLDAATAFYGDLLGWGSEPMEGDGPTYLILTRDDGEGIAGAMNPPMEGLPPHWGVYFAVDDTDAIVEKATAGGGSLLNGPMDIPVGRTAALADPQGGAFSVIALAEPPAS
jgi:predicted enzyme related to lactoylglutathione lyase